MTKRYQNVSRKRGDTTELEVPIVDESGNPLDLTNAQEIKWALYDVVDGAKSLVLLKQLSLLQISIIQIDGTGAVLDGVKVDIHSSDTEGLEPGNYQHECEVTESDGSVFTPFEGSYHLGEDLILSTTEAPTPFTLGIDPPNAGVRGQYFWPGWTFSSSLVDPVVNTFNAITLYHIYWPLKLTPNRVLFRTDSPVSVTTGIGLYSSDGQTLITKGKLTHASNDEQVLNLSPVVEIPPGMLTLAFTNTDFIMDYRGHQLPFLLDALLNAGSIPSIARANEASVAGELPATVSRDFALNAPFPWLWFLASSG